MRVAAKVDDNQPQIVKAFRQLGFSVLHLHQLGKGCPDILIGRNGLNWLIEIKDGDKPLSKQKLTADELIFHESWEGQVRVIKNIEEVIAFSKNVK